jgi:hypothetical protein
MCDRDAIPAIPLSAENQTPLEDVVFDPQEQSFEHLLSGILPSSRQIQEWLRYTMRILLIILLISSSGRCGLLFMAVG